MDESAVKAIAELAREAEGQVVEADGLRFIQSTLKPARQPEPEPKLLQITALEGLVDFVLDEGAPKDVAVQVAGHDLVRVVSRRLVGEFQQRFVYAAAQHADLFGEGLFNFKTFYPVEVFVIALQVLFVDNPDRAKILKAVGNVTDSTVFSAEDDGTTQTVTGRKGVSLKSEIKVPNPVTLRPYRTFLEVEQPESPFILRVKGGQEGELPRCALFEADGGAWKLTAITNIQRFLRARLKAVPVFA